MPNWRRRSERRRCSGASIPIRWIARRAEAGAGEADRSGLAARRPPPSGRSTKRDRIAEEVSHAGHHPRFIPRRAASGRRTRSLTRAGAHAPRPARRATRPESSPASGRSPARPGPGPGWFDLGEQVEHLRGSIAGRDAHPGVRGPGRPPPPPSAPVVSRFRPPASVYLAAFVSRLPTTWVSRFGSAATRTGRSVWATIEPVAGRLDQRPGLLDGVGRDLGGGRPAAVGGRPCRG